MNRLEKKIFSHFEEALHEKVKDLLSKYVDTSYKMKKDGTIVRPVFSDALEGSITTTAELMVKYLMEEDDE